MGKMAKAEDTPHWAWAKVFFAVGMAFTLCLRVSDVANLRWRRLEHKNWIVFSDYKVAKERFTQPIPPFWDRWRQWLYEHRRPHHHNDALVLPHQDHQSGHG